MMVCEREEDKDEVDIEYKYFVSCLKTTKTLFHVLVLLYSHIKTCNSIFNLILNFK